MCFSDLNSKWFEISFYEWIEVLLQGDKKAEAEKDLPLKE